MSLHRIEQSVQRVIRSIRQATVTAIGPTVVHWWKNPLLFHARREKPLPWPLTGWWFGLATALLSVFSILAWIFSWRSVGALLIGLSLAAVLAATLSAPVISADRVARQMWSLKHDPRRLTDLAPRDVVWGLALVTLWRLRWLIIAGLAATPALIIGLLRMDVASFGVWQDSVQALGASTLAGNVGWLPSDGHTPYFRLALRAVSAGLLPWALLPLLALLGVTAALVLHDASLSPLVALLGGVLLSVMIAAGWNMLTRTPLLADGLEIVRLFLLAGLMLGIGAGAVWVNRWNGEVLASTHSQ